jgi:hypothetical protein
VNPWATIAVVIGVALTTGCGGEGNPFADSPCSPTASKWADAKPPADLPVAPESERVDRYAPSFSNPTKVTNPLHPSSRVRSALLLGKEEGQTLRVEVTLLGTKTIACGGRPVQTLESQYVAFLDGKIHEVALDWYAQDDDGAVWYFGEDVFNFEDGVVADTEGTWMAGRDGPAAMIMPADPQVGDVYRPENIPGLVFEEVTVKAVDRRVAGPRGPVDGAILIEELHMDGKRESKTFAPGYGEFSTGAGNNLEALALAVPIDRTPRRVPPLLGKQLREALQRGDDLGIRLADLDLQLSYQRPVQIDRTRFKLWTQQAELDVAARDADALKGDIATLERIADRFPHGPAVERLLRRLRKNAASIGSR